MRTVRDAVNLDTKSIFAGGLLAALGGVLLAACGNDYEVGQDLPEWPASHPRDVESRDWTDRLVQLTLPEVDVLFTIDNSSSMENEQRALVENFPAFADYFLNSGLDYHIGVISTDIEHPVQDGHLHGANGYLYIDTETEEPTEVFSAMASMGTDGSGNESGIGAVYAALTTRRADNGDFYRDEASLHTVVISDEEDQTPARRIPLDEFIEWYAGLKPTTEDRTFSSIVSFVNQGSADRGTRYLATTDQIGGIRWNIADEDWAEVLQQLSLVAAGYRHEFFMSHRPVPETIEVYEETAGGVTYLHEPEVWEWSEIRNSITFKEYVPAPLSTIVIHYVLLASE